MRVTPAASGSAGGSSAATTPAAALRRRSCSSGSAHGGMVVPEDGMNIIDTQRWAWRTQPFLRKPMSVVVGEAEEEKLERRLSLFDLLAIGIGGTVGSGVFVLAGEIANAPDLPAGPAVALSFLAAGLGCVLSGLSFAELASRIHADGSSYAYAYVTLGEVFAFVAGCCLTLEYGVSSAAVARVWGDKLGAWINHLHPHDASKASLWHPGSGGEGSAFLRDFNLYAGLIELVCMCIMLRGVNLSKLTVDVFTVGKLVLVVFMTIAGFSMFKPSHMTPFAPSGFKGVFRGAMRSFFGYLGYDEVCCLGGEAKNPAKNIPLAVLGTISAVTVLYVLASLALVGMLPYQDISPSSGFPEAFRTCGVAWAGHVVAAGELLTLPLVVLVSLLAQPRLQFAMAEDGLLPALFGRVDRKGNLFVGTLIAGMAGVLIALFLPFRALEDMISAGVLIAFNLTNAGLIVSRRLHPTRPDRNRLLVLAYNLLALTASFLWVNLGGSMPWLPLNVLVTLAALVPLILLEVTCPDQVLPSDGHFGTPLVPWVPGLGAAFNWFLLAQLNWEGLWLLLVYIGISLLLYALWGFPNSKGGKTGWQEVLTASLRRHSRHSTADVDPALMASLLGDGKGEEGDGGDKGEKRREGPEQGEEEQMATPLTDSSTSSSS